MAETGAEDHSAAPGQMLGLQLSHRCNVACRSCVFDCGPRNGDVMPLRDARKVLERARNLPLVPVIGLTGGEPFLQPGVLKDLCRFIRDHLDFKISISTNAFWAGTERQAHAVLEELQDLGLIALLISVDDFHQEFVALRNIRNAIRAAADLSISCILQCVETRTSRKANDYVHELNLDSKEELVRSVSIACDPVGRATREIPQDEFVYCWQNKAGICSMLQMWIIDPSGNVLPCCGTAAHALPALGNAFEESLVDIVHRANADPLLNALAAWGGPFLLFRELAENGMPAYETRSYVSACHACHSLFRDRVAMNVLKERLASRQVELVAARLIAQRSHAEWRSSGEGDGFPIPAAW